MIRGDFTRRSAAGLILPSLSFLAAVAFWTAAFNLAVLSAIGHYDLRLGPVHLAASSLFKPLLYLNAAFLINLALRSRATTGEAESLLPVRTAFAAGWRFWAAAVLLVLAVYGVTFAVNLDYSDWTHRGLTAGRPLLSFFTDRQYDGFYRPLTFISLWLDNALFGPALWAYHIQNLLIHLLNGYLVARLAARLGFKALVARWAGIAFLVVPGLFEAVIWPGARFDLLALAFLLFALERTLAGYILVGSIAYALGVLAKETAYAYPILLLALFLLRRPLLIGLSRVEWLRAFSAALIVTAGMIAVRLAVYGNLGGYPDVNHPGHSVNFVLSTGTVTSVFTRLPAALFLVNSGAGLPLWLKATLIGYVALLSALMINGATARRGTWLFLLSFAAVAPMANMFGWMNPFAQQGRYLYSPAVWIVLPTVLAIRSIRRHRLVFAGWVLVASAAALFNSLVYVRLMRSARAAAAEASSLCRGAKCCQHLILQNLPRDLNGAFYFGSQVTHDLRETLPKVAVTSTETAERAETVVPEASSCLVALHWNQNAGWNLVASNGR